jgi:hypothetical protein
MEHFEILINCTWLLPLIHGFFFSQKWQIYAEYTLFEMKNMFLQVIISILFFYKLAKKLGPQKKNH